MTSWAPARLSLAIGVALAAGGCAQRPRGDIAYNPTTFTAPDTQYIPLAADAYRIGPADVLTVQVFGVPEVSGDFQVMPTGNITMPLIGDVAAQQKTAVELAGALKTRLGEKYYNNPNVTVSVKQANSQRITLDGAVSSPGVYPVAGQLTLLQAVALAKGTTEQANPKRVVVFRQIQGQRAAAAFDLQQIREGLMPDPQLYGNDIVVVDGDKRDTRLQNILRAVPLLNIFTPF